MSSTSIVWQMSACDGREDAEEFDRELITKRRHETILRGYWAEDADGAEDAATQVAEDFWRHNRELWEQWFGDDMSATVLLRIYEPAAITGTFLINLNYIVRATAEHLSRGLSEVVTES